MTKDEIDDLITDICDGYCKYPEEWDEEKAGIPLIDSEICRNCPLNRLEKLNDRN